MIGSPEPLDFLQQTALQAIEEDMMAATATVMATPISIEKNAAERKLSPLLYLVSINISLFLDV